VDSIHAAHIVDLRFEYTIGEFSLADLLQEELGACFRAVEDVFEREKCQDRLYIVELGSDFLVLDPTKVTIQGGCPSR